MPAAALLLVGPAAVEVRDDSVVDYDADRGAELAAFGEVEAEGVAQRLEPRIAEAFDRGLKWQHVAILPWELARYCPIMRVAVPGLPEPTGPYPAGITSLWLRDTARPDPWVAGVSARELMVSLWYPAASSDGQRARYVTPAESRLQLTSRGITGVPPDALSTVRTNAAVDAAPAGRQRSLPLVVLSPGFTSPRSTLTALAEDLASHGYVVAGIDHTYESFATAFPDGRVTTCRAREGPRGRGFWEKVTAGRAADVCFVLGELTGAHPAWPGAALIDPSRMAMAGHSVGGAAAISAMLADSRIRAGIDMDGATHAPIPDSGLSRPFLFLGKQSNYTPGGEGVRDHLGA